eukprot:TRINITY_DN2451_c0_g1_i1.p2 TRINITY_DN2451_c0_g1~~TRINITY_DN2451_c0_g1_i1.p2  ORF type:complete len:129 (+),score=28.30 TRINITY_DN2451_c0_g1_i1:23-409(+)
MQKYTSLRYWGDRYTAIIDTARDKTAEAADHTAAVANEEWFLDAASFCSLVHNTASAHLKDLQTATVLHLGCGLSDVAGLLYKHGFRTVVHVDFSEVAVRSSAAACASTATTASAAHSCTRVFVWVLF